MRPEEPPDEVVHGVRVPKFAWATQNGDSIDMVVSADIGEALKI